MANEEYLEEYRRFFQYFDETLDPYDQLPVKLASYKLCKKEVVGAIFNWTNQYLSDKKCPMHLISFLSRIVIEKTRKRCKKQPVQCGFNPSDNAYEPLKLMHTVIEVINEVCFNYKSSLSVQNRQNMAVSYPLPAPEEVYNVVSLSALKNSRRKMEDRFIAIHDLNTIFTKQDATPSHYYAVFDGHGGEHAAVYSANHLHQYLAESTNFTTNPEEAIKDAFCKTDAMLIKKSKTDKIPGGTTVVCALLLPKEKTLYIAWVGDSQAVLVGEGKILPCVVPHKPEREDERQRIVEDGGVVLHYGVWRVNGQLSVSRAIGDVEYKPYVTAVPEMVKIPLGGEEDFIILASDGLWDYVSKLEMAKVVYNTVYSDPEKAQEVSRELVQTAKCSGSADNISVIVVFLKDPHQIAAGPRWNNRLVSMDTLDNANNPFAIPNKTNNVVDSITTQTEDGLLLNFAEGLKKNDDLPNNDLIKMLEKSNCDRLSPDFDKEENLGPETNVDNPDSEPASPNFDVSKRQQREAINNNQNCNPFNDIEKSLELNLNLKEGTFEGLLMSPTEEECVQPLIENSVHNVSQLIDAGAESDSEEDEEEWNYVRGEEANKENAKPSLQLSSQVAEEEEEDDIENAMSQLNPNAAEFVPSPARAVASPLGRLLDEDQVISRSPKKPPPTEVDLNVPDMCDFEKDISQKPHEIEAAFGLNNIDHDKPHENGHQDNFNNETNAINALNSRLDEFHFGPNAAPFTPAKLDQSEASSTRANFGDESEMTLGTSFNDSMLSQDQNDFVQKDDPMSMSFHQDRSDDSNLFDLNKVHILPENVDEFIANKEENTDSLLDDTISDLTEHYPLGKPEESKQTGIEITTDLDHEEQKMEHLQINQSSTPIDERSKSPSGLQTPVEDERAVSPRDDTQTPFEESSVSSSVGECALPKVEDHLQAPMEAEHILLSQFDQNKPSAPFEENHLISPLEEHKLSSPYEEKEMYSTEEEKDICSPVEEKDVCCLIRKQNEPQNEEKEVFEEKDLLSEKDIIQDEKYLIDEKQLIEDKESVSEKEVIEEKDVLEEKYTISSEPQRDILSPVEAIPSPVSPRDFISPVQERQVTSPQQLESEEERNIISPVQEKEIVSAAFETEISSLKSEEIVSPEQEVFERQIISPIQDREITSPLHEERDVDSPLEEKLIASLVQDEEITSVVREVELASPNQEECSLVEGGKLESPSLEQEISTAEIKEDYCMPIEPSKLINEPSEVTTSCDNLENSQQKLEPVGSEPSVYDNEFLKFETEKSDEEKAKENLESFLQFDNSNKVLSPQEKSASSEIVLDECVNKNESPCDISTEPEKPVDSPLEVEESLIKEVASLSLAEPNVVPTSLVIDPSNVDVHSQPTPEADQLLINDSNLQCSFKSVTETSSVNTTDVMSVFDQSLLGEVQCPISPNLSTALADVTSEAVTAYEITSESLKAEQSAEISMSSPTREQHPDSSQVTSTPLANKLEVPPISTQVKSPVEDKTPKTKEADKKPTKGKVTPSTTSKKTPTSRTSLGSSRTTATPSPKPAARTASKTTTTATSKLNSTTKTETAASRIATKSLLSAAPKPATTSAAPKASSTTAKVPLSSRTNLKSALPKTTATNGTAKPAAKPSTGITKKPEGSSTRSTTLTGVSKTTSATSRTNVSSARSATTTAAPKPRPNTLKPAPSRTVAAPKPTTTSTRPTTAAPRVPLASRTTATKSSSSLATKEVSKTLSKPKSVTDKQVKETANKLTAASRAVSKTTSTMQSLAKSTTVTKKTEVTGTKTTSRTTTTTSSRAPIKKPADTSKTATTKLTSKPKQNGVAPVVTEKIIVSNGTKELDNVIDQFIKDNSPVDNKLITDNLSESAAN